VNAHTAQNLWPALIADVQTPGLLLQLLVLIICLFGGWRISQLLVRHFSHVDASLSGSEVPIDSFHRVLAPLLAVVLVALAVPALDHWQNAHSLRIVLPLLLAFLLIRTVFFMLRKAFAKDGRIGRALRAVEQSFALIVWLGLALYASGLWPELIELLEQTTVPIGRHRESVLIILQALISVAVTVMIALWASAVL
jgi:ABC-type transport system involved in cytochrome bd biosynthesis fused ATPase/permease subunit